MEIYLVGGAVRDALLGLPVKEKDYVVVGATVEEMLRLGYRQVGKDFPVFLHPETKEEYALARRERKVSRGYTGFTFDTTSTVTLEDDLLRRDLTINAMATRLETGNLIDPFHGKMDLDKRLLRHVSPAFVEDPVRILRVARFAARFAVLGFTVAAETNVLMQQMVKNGEVNALVAERVWKELERALQEKNPEVFFEVLAACHALSVLFPDIRSENIQQLRQVIKQTDDPEIRFAVLLSGLSKEKISNLVNQYRIPTRYKELALLVSTYYSDYQHIADASAEAIVDFLQRLDGFRREPRFKQFLLACQLIENQLDASKAQRLLHCLLMLKQMPVEEALNAVSDKDKAKKIKELRIQLVQALMKSQ